MARTNGLMYLGIGAALMYLLDPQQGRKRRNDLRNQVDATRRKVQRGSDAVLRDATNRTHGMLVETRQWLQACRERLEQRAANDMDRMAGDLEDASGVALSKARRATAPWRRARWSPAQRALAGIAGASLATSGYVRGGLLGLAMGITGVGLIARAAANEELGTLAKGRMYTIDRTLRVDAPVEKAYAYWKDFENFPRWMSHVREVTNLGDGRWHWSVEGPAGAPVEWDSEITEDRPDQLLAWRSVAGSTVQNGGRVRFERDGDATRVRIELHYSPPGGAIGQAVAKAFGADPASEMDDDLSRLASRIESSATRGNGAAHPQDGAGLGAAPT